MYFIFHLNFLFLNIIVTINPIDNNAIPVAGRNEKLFGILYIFIIPNIPKNKIPILNKNAINKFIKSLIFLDVFFLIFYYYFNIFLFINIIIL